MMYSYVPNKRAAPNKRADWIFSEILITVQGENAPKASDSIEKKVQNWIYMNYLASNVRLNNIFKAFCSKLLKSKNVQAGTFGENK